MSCLVAQSHHSRQIWKCLFRTLVIEGAVKVSGGHTGGATPDPIPNSEVKTSRAHGTAGETLWESRSPPGLFRRSPRALNKLGGFFLFIAFRTRRRVPNLPRRGSRLRAGGGQSELPLPGLPIAR